MGEFFRGWRRKAGLVTLAMACLLTVAWMRSYVVLDWVWFSHGATVLASSNAGFSWQRGDPTYGRQWGWGSQTIEPNQYARDVKWLFQWAGFKAAEHSYPSAKFWVIPYWSLILPLTLLSAWLILTKSRPAKSAKESNHA